MSALTTPAKTTALEPLVDVFDSDDELLLLIDLPGVAREQLQVSVKAETLTLEAKRDDDSLYSRSFQLPRSVDTERISVSLQDGVARATLPKLARAKPQRIPVH